MSRLLPPSNIYFRRTNFSHDEYVVLAPHNCSLYSALTGFDSVSSRCPEYERKAELYERLGGADKGPIHHHAFIGAANAMGVNPLADDFSSSFRPP